jgi:CrcB protein
VLAAAKAAAMRDLFFVMAGGAIGSGLRWQAGRIALDAFGPAFPWGTWIVNLVGGFLAGLIAGLLLHQGSAGEPMRMFLIVGLLGGFTTFSAFSLEAAFLIQRGQHAAAAAYAISSFAGSVLLLFAGLWLARAVAA